MEFTQDTVLDGRVQLRQSRHGYRAGLDAALLAAACDAAAGQRVIEAGCGVGAVMLPAATRRQGTNFTGIEVDPDYLSLAKENVVLNGLADRVQVMVGDVAARFKSLNLPAFDAALANPPFFDDASELRAPSPARRGAWMNDEGLAAWIAFLGTSVREGGTITLIHRADKLGDILSSLRQKCGGIQILPIHPFADVAAKRVLVRAIKISRASLRLLPPLIVHDRQGGGHTKQVEDILRGRRALTWLD